MSETPSGVRPEPVTMTVASRCDGYDVSSYSRHYVTSTSPCFTNISKLHLDPHAPSTRRRSPVPPVIGTPSASMAHELHCPVSLSRQKCTKRRGSDTTTGCSHTTASKLPGFAGSPKLLWMSETPRGVGYSIGSTPGPPMTSTPRFQ